jgi:hypothetical protein
MISLWVQVEQRNCQVGHQKIDWWTVYSTCSHAARERFLELGSRELIDMWQIFEMSEALYLRWFEGSKSWLLSSNLYFIICLLTSLKNQWIDESVISGFLSLRSSKLLLSQASKGAAPPRASTNTCIKLYSKQHVKKKPREVYGRIR